MKLIDLPPELIARVFVFLEDFDVFSARLSNRSLEKASFSHFGKRFFRKRGFLVMTPSLKVLQEIANHNELSKYVQHVWFNPDCFTFVYPVYRRSKGGGTQLGQVEHAEDDDDGRDYTDADDLDGSLDHHGQFKSTKPQFEAWGAYTRDHFKLLRDHDRLPSLLEHHLTVVFEKLPNLATIGMRRSENHAPYGWRDLKKAVGRDPRELGPIPSDTWCYLSDSTQLFIALISAAANAKVHPKRLYTDTIELDNIGPEDLPPWKLQASCSSLSYLELNIIRGRLYLPPIFKNIRYRDLDNSANGHFGENLTALLQATPTLKELGLQILPNRAESHPPIPAPRQQVSYPYITFHRITQQTCLPNLTRIKLEKITTTAPTLEAFLQPSADRLTSLKLRDITLLPTTSPTTTTQQQPWSSLFHLLTMHCPRLEYILFYHLMHDRGGISFVEEPPEEQEVSEEDGADEYVVGQAVFEKYTHITLEVKGREAVREKLEEVVRQHWYHRPLFSYAMDEELWHTDTSDEEW